MAYSAFLFYQTYHKLPPDLSMVIFELMYCIPTMCQSFRILHLGTKINGYCKYLLVLDVHIREKLVVSNLYHSIKTTQFTFLSSSTAKESASLFINIQTKVFDTWTHNRNDITVIISTQIFLACLVYVILEKFNFLNLTF